MLNWLHLWPAGFLLCLPWLWLEFDFLASGGFVIDVMTPPCKCPAGEADIPFRGAPDYVGEIRFSPSCINILGWTVPQAPWEWRRRFKWWRKYGGVF